MRTLDVVASAASLPDLSEPTRVLALVWDENGQSVALEGPRTEWAYEAAIRISADLAIQG